MGHLRNQVFALEVRQDLELSENIFKFCYHNRKSGGMKNKRVRITRGKEISQIK